MSGKKENFENFNNSHQSLILTTRFGITSAKLIHSVEKNLYVSYGYNCLNHCLINT